MSEGGTIKIRIPTGGRCEDCDIRNSLTLTGRPRIHEDYGFELTSGCEGCGGTGEASKIIVLRASVALARLTEKQRFVIERRFGLLDGHRYSQQEIAAAMGVSRPVVSKHEKAARKRLLWMANGYQKAHIST